MKILVLNAGSSSLKFSLFNGPDSDLVEHGVIEHLGEKNTQKTHADALVDIETRLREKRLLDDFGQCEAIAHRVVHGGEMFHEPVFINEDVIAQINALSELAPLHNPANALPIQWIQTRYPNLAQVAVFDTSFHQSMPDYAFHYAVPNRFYEEYSIRRYGFHGTSHEYITARFAALTDRELDECHIISMHLGNGGSICAIEFGESIDTSMGFTPMEGVIMGTRPGDLDASIPIYMIRHLGFSPDDVDRLLNNESGLLGLCGENDMRDIIAQSQQGNDLATLALDMYVYRINKLVGSYMAVMDQLDALVFTGGIGEHAAYVREQILEGFSTRMNVLVDEEKNEQLRTHGGEGKISHDDSDVEVWVIPTDEEWQIAQHALDVLERLD